MHRRVSLALAGLFAFALAVRLWFNLAVHQPFTFVFSDMWVYDHRAQDLLLGREGPWDTFTPSGFPALLAMLYRLFGPRPIIVPILMALLGALLVPLTFAIGRRVLSPALALVAAALVAVYLPLVYYGGFLLTEIPFAALALASLWLGLRSVERPDGRVLVAALAGLSLAAAATVRANGLLILPILLALPWLARVEKRRRFVLALVTLAAALPLLVVVSAHNTTLRGRRTGLATNGGLNFFLAHAPYRSVLFHEGTFTHHITPIRNDLYYRQDFVSPVPFYEEEYFYKMGVQAFAERPMRAIWSLNNVPELVGLGRQSYWPYWPKYEALMRTLSVGFFFVLGLPALAGLGVSLVRRRWSGPAEQLMALVLASTVLVAYLYLGDPRLRLPFDPLFAILALAALSRAWQVWKRRRAPEPRPQ